MAFNCVKPRGVERERRFRVYEEAPRGFRPRPRKRVGFKNMLKGYFEQFVRGPKRWKELPAEVKDGYVDNDWLIHHHLEQCLREADESAGRR